MDEITNEKHAYRLKGRGAKDQTVDSSERLEENQEIAVLGEKQVVNRA